MNRRSYMMMFILVLCWGLGPYFKKISSKNLTKDEYLILNHVIVSVILTFYGVYLYKNNKCDYKKLISLDFKQSFMCVVSAIISIVGGFVLVNLVKENDTSMVMSHIEPLVILFTTAIGVLFLHEKINKQQLIGIGMITAGVYFIKKYENK